MKANTSDSRDLMKLYEGISDFSTQTPIEGQAGHYDIHPKSNDAIIDDIVKMQSGTERSRLIDLLTKREYMKIMKALHGNSSDSSVVLTTAKNRVADMLKQKGLRNT
jgi:hypothetical protein